MVNKNGSRVEEGSDSGANNGKIDSLGHDSTPVDIIQQQFDALAAKGFQPLI